jgi:hypothetical protein
MSALGIYRWLAAPASVRGQSASRFPSYPPPPRDVCLRPDALRLPKFQENSPGKNRALHGHDFLSNAISQVGGNFEMRRGGYFKMQKGGRFEMRNGGNFNANTIHCLSFQAPSTSKLFFGCKVSMASCLFRRNRALHTACNPFPHTTSLKP